jgi:putative transposase
VSAIAALTADGRVLMQVQQCAFRGPQVVRFLRHLLRHIPGQLLVIWDGSPIHGCGVVKDFCGKEVLHASGWSGCQRMRRI